MGWTGNSPNQTYSRATGLQSGSTAWADTEAASRGIESTDHDTHDQSLADGINTSLQKDGKNKATADIDMGGFKLTTLGTPTNSTDAANKSYVDGVAIALVNFTVRLATTVAITKATDIENGDTLDGVVIATNDRILLKNQAAPAENGIWVAAASGAPTRATDMDTWTETLGAIVNVTAGTAGANTSWRSTSNSGGTINSTSLTFVTFGTSLTTPISLANGGTANVTAAASFAALKQDATTAATGVVERATTAEVLAGTATTFPACADIAASGDEVALSDGATVTVDFSTGINFKLDTIGGNRTLAASNYSGLIGRSGYIRIVQDGTGTRTLTTSASPWVNASSTDIVLSTATGSVDMVWYQVLKIGGSAKIFLSITKAVG